MKRSLEPPIANDPQIISHTPKRTTQNIKTPISTKKGKDPMPSADSQITNSEPSL